MKAGKIYFRRRIHWSAYVLGSFWIVFGLFMALGSIVAATRANGIAVDFYFVVGTVVFFYSATQAYRLMMDEGHFGTIHLPSTEETGGRH